MEGPDAMKRGEWLAHQGEPGFRAACGAPANDRPRMAGPECAPWTAAERRGGKSGGPTRT